MGVVDDFVAELRTKILAKKKRKQFQRYGWTAKGASGSVAVDMKQNKVTVTGYVEQAEVLEPYDVVPHPYEPGAYDKKAPPGYVRNALADPNSAPLARASSAEERYASAFSDENPNSCVLM